MFILPAHAAPFAAVASLDAAAQRAWWTLPLTLLATLLILALVRAVTVTALFYGRRAPALPLAVLEKGALGLKPVVTAPPAPRRWLHLPFLSSSPATPATSTTPAPDAAQIPSSPLSQAPPAGRGRPAARAGAVRRPEPALSVRARVEAPLPALYECQTPASMAKMIMSRHPCIPREQPLPLTLALARRSHGGRRRSRFAPLARARVLGPCMDTGLVVGSGGAVGVGHGLPCPALSSANGRALGRGRRMSLRIGVYVFMHGVYVGLVWMRGMRGMSIVEHGVGVMRPSLRDCVALATWRRPFPSACFPYSPSSFVLPHRCAYAALALFFPGVMRAVGVLHPPHAHGATYPPPFYQN
ncbi:hypothetical protein B0H16DRAFT_1473559 [Mycena metata]|uniref:Uncharacterized protein n=1 Tax=Mycena metata TaxID=1033252 RepID=A0AAD7HKA5_9AGAR|nr:hypothetical protein B0H16DRAFT_1473559 [Mycena metata]